MSTRATYRFIGEYQDVTFYIHYDGYPEYAWNYFQNAISFEGSGTLADSFHRANDISEITQSHETHGDTEFQYTVTFKNYGEGAHIKAVKVDLGGEILRTFFSGSLEDFIQAKTELLTITGMKLKNKKLNTTSATSGTANA